MAIRDTYEMQTWENLPSETTPVNAERLSHIEQGIKDAMDNRALKEIYDDDAINLGRRSGTSVGSHSTAEGNGNLASGQNSHAEGMNTESSGFNSHAEGYGTKATASGSHAENGNTEASGTNSHAEGMGTKAIGYVQHVSGKYNQPNNNLATIVGGGASDSDRKNIHTLDWSGNAYFAGDVTNGAGVSLNGLKTALDSIQSSYMTYEETTTALNSQETGEINKIPNVYAIRDWCKALINPSEEV